MGTSPEELRQQIEATRTDMTRNVDVLSEKVSPAAIAGRQVDTVRGAFTGVKEKVMGAADQGTEKLSATGSSLSDKASDLGDTVSEAPAAVRYKTQGNPLAAGLIAFGAGLLVSSMMPASQTEQQAAVALKERAAPLIDEAKSQARELKEDLQPVAQDAMQQVKSAAADAAATTKDQATSAASDVADHAKAAAADTKDDAVQHAAQAKDEATTSTYNR